MIQLGIAVDGGKDSLSMATKMEKEKDGVVKSPRGLVISAYAPMDDITKVVTQDINAPGESLMMWIDLSGGKARLGGSALAQCYGQIGNESPDVDDPDILKRAFTAIQSLMVKNLILSGHDISDGGLIITLLEMAFAGNCGFDVNIVSQKNPLKKIFAEELGAVVECHISAEKEAHRVMNSFGIYPQTIGRTTKERRIVVSSNLTESILDADMRVLRQQWEETSYQIERLQKNSECADQEKKNIFDRKGPTYDIPFAKFTSEFIFNTVRKPEVAILREEGSNGDREMTSAFYQAGFSPWDVTMTDLLSGRVTLERFRGVVAVGGFSYADVPESAKGWAAGIRFNEQLRKMFDAFYNRPDTFSLGVCNGCQLFALIGWVPWRGISDDKQPRFVQNVSRKFESRWVTVMIRQSSAIMLKDMVGSRLGIWVAHGEGRLQCQDQNILDRISKEYLAPIIFVDDEGHLAGEDAYPFNPNGSPFGITALCSPDGRHLAMMPHPERSFLKWQWPWMPDKMRKEMQDGIIEAPWIRMFQNARQWCEAHK